MYSSPGSKSFRLNGNLQDTPMLPALRLVQSSRIARRIAYVLMFMLVVTSVAMVFAPWQQTVTGSGRVIALDPLERQQVVKATISGRIKSWAEGLRDGVYVETGDEVLVLEDNDPELRERAERNVELLDEKIRNATEKITQYEGYVTAFTDARLSTIEGARELISEAESDLEAKRRDLDAAKASFEQKESNMKRQQLLFDNEDGGLTSKYKLEVAVREAAEADQKVKAAESYVTAAEAKVRAKKADLAKKDREASAKVSAAEADLRTARADLATYNKELVDASSKLKKLERAFTVTAPKDGYLLNVAAFQGGEYVKPGDPLFTLVPNTTQKAVEFWVSGNDVPLVEPGRHVRLQFEGWPAVQFSGWPAVAVGTFGGTVTTVDRTDDGKGRFRVLVTPDSETDWPDNTYLRQGGRTNAWVLLDQVPLGYEVWRRLNGFPPSVAIDKEKKPAKPPKPST